MRQLYTLSTEGRSSRQAALILVNYKGNRKKKFTMEVQTKIKALECQRAGLVEALWCGLFHDSWILTHDDKEYSQHLKDSFQDDIENEKGTEEDDEALDIFLFFRNLINITLKKHNMKPLFIETVSTISKPPIRALKPQFVLKFSKIPKPRINSLVCSSSRKRTQVNSNSGS